MSHMAEYTCCSSAAFERPNENTFTFTPRPIRPIRPLPHLRATAAVDRYVDGVDHALWWSAVTVTTVGYGDKAPVTRVGRLFAVIWMFCGIAMVSWGWGLGLVMEGKGGGGAHVRSHTTLVTHGVLCDF
jgi:hypothetical protein